jgi:hypothetical protein
MTKVRVIFILIGFSKDFFRILINKYDVRKKSV